MPFSSQNILSLRKIDRQLFNTQEADDVYDFRQRP